MSVLYRAWCWTRNDARNKIRGRGKAKMEVEPAGAGLARVRDQYGKPLVLLMGVVACCCCWRASTWRACCWRVGGAAARMAVRVGLGAGRGRLVRQMLTESRAAFRGRHAGGRRAGVFRNRRAGANHGQRPRDRAHRDRGAARLPPAALHRRNRGVHRAAVRAAPAWYAFRAAPAAAMRQTERRAIRGSGGCSEKAWWQRRWRSRFFW